jgi:hypothetical protein
MTRAFFEAPASTNGRSAWPRLLRADKVRRCPVMLLVLGFLLFVTVASLLTLFAALCGLARTAQLVPLEAPNAA